MATRIIFLPSSDDGIDVDAKVDYIFNILREVFSMAPRDNVVIAVETFLRGPERAVSLIYNEEWRCQIYVNHDKEKVRLDSKNWCNLYGAHLSNESKQEIITCSQRLDLYADPDREHLYDGEFAALTDFLQLNFKSRYSFDPSQHSFVVIEI